MWIKYLTKSNKFHYWNTQLSCIISNFLDLIMGIYEKHTADFTLTGEILNIFPLISRLKQGCLLSPVLFNTVLEHLGKEKKWNSLYLQMTLPYTQKIQWNPVKKIIRTNKQVWPGRKIQNKYIIYKQTVFLHSNSEQSKNEFKKIVPFTIVKDFGLNFKMCVFGGSPH